MNEILITISGTSGSGKSSIMEMIYRSLWIQGFKVDLQLEENDFDDFDDERDFRLKMNKNREERLDAIKNKTIITLKELHTNKPLNF